MKTSSPSTVTTRRALNFRALALFVAALAGLTVGIYALHDFQVKRRAGSLLRLSDQAEAAGQTAKAIELLERYLNLRRGDDEVFARYGLLLDKTAATAGAREQAYLVLEQSIGRNPRRQDLLRKAADLAAAKFGRFTDARRYLGNLLNHHQPDAETVRMIEGGEIERLIGDCFEGEGKVEEAITWYEKSIKRRPKQIDSYGRAAFALRRRLKQPAQADPFIDRMVKANQESAQALVVRGRYRHEFGLPDADRDISRLGKRPPTIRRCCLPARPRPCAIRRRRMLRARGATWNARMAFLPRSKNYSSTGQTGAECEPTGSGHRVPPQGPENSDRARRSGAVKGEPGGQLDSGRSIREAASSSSNCDRKPARKMSNPLRWICWTLVSRVPRANGPKPSKSSMPFA